MSKKILSRILTFVFLVTVLVGSGIFFTSPVNQDGAIAATDTWKTELTTTTLSEDSDGYLMINTVNDFATFCYSKLVNTHQYGRLYADISLSLHNWEPAVLSQYSILDGNYHVISDLRIDGTEYSQAGLFSKIDDYAQVKNLNISSATITNPIQYAGFIAGYCGKVNSNYGSNIENCNIMGAKITYEKPEGYTSTLSLTIGGIAGFSYTSVIKNCHVSYQLSHKNVVRGILPDNICAGGIVGEASNTTISVCRYIDDNISGGATQLLYAYATKTACVGGIAGKMTWHDSKGTSLIEKCYTTKGGSPDYCVLAGIANTTMTAYAGGIVGYLHYGQVSNCFNTVPVRARAKSVNKEETFDTAPLPGQEPKQILDSKFYVVSGQTTNQSAQGPYKTEEYVSYHHRNQVLEYAGGIAGYAEDGTAISYVYNTGKVTCDGYTQNEYCFYFKHFKEGPFGVHYFNYAPTIEKYILDYTITKGSIVGFGRSVIISNSYAEEDIHEHYNYSMTHRSAPTLNGDYHYRVVGYVSGADYADSYQYYCYTMNDLNDMWWDYFYKKEMKNEGQPDHWDLTSTTISKIATANSSVWAIDSSKNDGNPIIKDFYWEYNGNQPNIIN